MELPIPFRNFILSVVLLSLSSIHGVLGQTDTSTHPAYFGTVLISPEQVLNGSGSDVDTIAFWIAPDPLNSIMFVTAKGNDLVEVWHYPFHEDSAYTELNFDNSAGCLGGDRVNGAIVDQEQNLLYIAVSAPDNNLCLFEVDAAEIRFLQQIDVDHNLGTEPNLGLIHHQDGQTYLYLSADDVIYIYDAETMTEIDQFDAFSVDEIEVVWGDDFYQWIYVPDENDHTGVYVYPIQADGTLASQTVINFGGQDIFDLDAEGVLVYSCTTNGQDNGKGWIVVSDQREDLTDFEFFDRESFAHLGSMNIEAVEMTDGIASTQASLPDYPLGVFAAIDDDRQTVIVDWQTILEATNLSCAG